MSLPSSGFEQAAQHRPPAAPHVSIVVPAHNEEAVLGRCLRALKGDAEPGEFDVVVVANACSDRTADVARTEGVRVIETPVPGKVNALNLGDAACVTFPRLYVDADVVIDTSSVRALAAALRQAAVLACAPVPRYDLRNTSVSAHRVHRVHQTLMSSRRHLAGAGAYALSQEGHARVFPLPDLIADDSWVDSSFGPGERIAVSGAHSIVRPARTVPSELRRRVRVRRGNHELDRLDRRPASTRLHIRALIGPMRSRSVSIPDTLLYLAVVVADRLLTASRLYAVRGEAWSSDATSRQPLPAPAVVEPEVRA